MSSEPRRLFVPSFFEGVLACALCEGVLFLTTANVRGMMSLFNAKGTPVPIWCDESKERECRRQHGEDHVKRGEALRQDGVYVLPPALEPTARDFGFPSR